MQYSDTGATTLYGLKQDIYYLGKCNSLSIADGDLNRIINKYYGQLQEVIRSVNENFYMVVATTDLVVGDGSYTYPDGTGTAPAYQKMRSVWAAMTAADLTNPLSTEYQRCIVADPDSISNPGYTFTNPTVLLFGTYFVLLPLITANPVTRGVKIYYIASQDKLVNDTDVPKIFDSFHDAITQGSLIDIAERLGNDKLKKDSAELFAKRLADIKSYASERLPFASSIVEGQEAQGGWLYPWGQDAMS